MTLTRQINPVVRAIAVIASVMALVTGVTFAALQDSVTLSNNTISSANADLQIWDGDSFEATAPGIQVTNLVPGQGSQDYPVYLKNNGANALYAYATVPNPPAEPSGGYDFTGWENLKVTIKSTEPNCVSTDSTVVTNMQALMDSQVALPCNTLAAGAQGDSGSIATEGNYTISFDIAPSSINGDSPGVGSFDLVISGSVSPITQVLNQEL